MTIQQVFEEFGTLCGLPKLRMEDNGSGALVFDDRYEVTYTLDTEDESLLLSAPIFTATTSRAPMLRHALETSYLGARTRGGTISIDPEREIYVYWKRHDIKAIECAQDLADITDRFLTELARIRKAADALDANGGMAQETEGGVLAQAKRDILGNDITGPRQKDVPPDAWLLYV